MMPAIIHCMFCGTVVNSQPQEAMKLYGSVVHSMVYDCTSCDARYLRRSDPNYYAVLKEPSTVKLHAMCIREE